MNTYRAVSQPRHGTLRFHADGSFTYTDTSGYHGWDSFSYVVNDGFVDSNKAVVLIEPPGSNYTPTVGSGTPALPPPVEPGLEALETAYTAAEALERKTVVAAAAVGQAEQAATMNPPPGIPDDDFQVANQNIILGLTDKAQGAYDAYAAQVTALTRAMGNYMIRATWSDAFYYQSAHDLEAKILALPISVCNYQMTGRLLASYQHSLNTFGTGAEYRMANATFAVQAAQATHRAAEAALLVGGLSSIVLIGIDLYSAEGCAAVLQYGLKSIVSLGVGAAANCVASVGCDVLAAKFGVNPDYLRIAADSVQLVCLIRAARSRNRMIGCFAGNTMVDTINHGFEPISAVHLGERVVTQPNDSSAGGAPLSLGGSTMVNPATWRVVDLTTADPNVPGDSYQMQLLEPLSWIMQEGAAAGKWIDVSIPELQISGRVQVVSIGACPSIESGGSGQVVLGTFEHVSTDVVNVNIVGQSQPLQVTSGHKLWSLDRGGWIQAGSLHGGERLEGQNGPVVVESVTADPTATRVYNLDVETDHRYLVTRFGVMAHNADPCSSIAFASEVGTLRDMPSTDTGIGIYDIETGQMRMAPSSELAEGGGGHLDLYDKLFGEEAAQALVDGTGGTNFRGFVVVKNSSGQFTILNNSSLNGTSLKMEPPFFDSIKSILLPMLNK